MPGFDGTGPRGAGPMTGRGEGYCAIRLPDEPGRPAYGYAGLEGKPVGAGMSEALPARRMPPYRRWPRPVMRPGLTAGRGPGRSARRGRRFGGR
jgi:hypothetical protein